MHSGPEKKHQGNQLVMVLPKQGPGREMGNKNLCLKNENFNYINSCQAISNFQITVFVVVNNITSLDCFRCFFT